jgi:hypothetical protein
MTNATLAQPNATIADEVRDFIKDYVSLPSESYLDILTLFVLHTHAFDAARTTPYIYITSQGPGSGKTRVMEVMQEICRKSSFNSAMTTATLFTMIDSRKPTLFWDEVDTIYSGSKNEELRGVLNSGYKHNGSVPRVDKSSEDGIRDYSTFCPKVLAGIDNGNVPDTVLDRSIKITLERAKPGQVKPFYSEDVEELAADIQDTIRAWVQANGDALRNRENRPAAMEGLTDRQNDMIRPLLMVADRIPGWHDRARAAFAHAFGAQETPLSPAAAALNTAREWFLMNPDADRIASRTIMDGAGINGKQLGSWMTQFGVKGGTYAIGGKNSKGYMKTELDAAFDRFLPALPNN